MVDTVRAGVCQLQLPSWAIPIIAGTSGSCLYPTSSLSAIQPLAASGDSIFVAWNDTVFSEAGSAGQGGSGTAIITSSGASFTAIAVDAAGNLYLADASNPASVTIQQYDASGSLKGTVAQGIPGPVTGLAAAGGSGGATVFFADAHGALYRAVGP